MERLKERLGIAHRALQSLEELLVIEKPSRIERDAAIQRFESSELEELNEKLIDDVPALREDALDCSTG